MPVRPVASPPLALGILACLLAAPLAAAAQTAPPAPAATAAPGSVPAAPPTPPLPTVTPSPLPTASLAPAPSPTADPYTYLTAAPAPAAAPTGGPQIIDVGINDRTLRPGAPLLVRVRTSPNVVGVEARAFGRFLAIPVSAPGTFVLQGTFPGGGIPFFAFGRDYDIVFAAATADGRQTTLTVPVRLDR